MYQAIFFFFPSKRPRDEASVYFAYNFRCLLMHSLADCQSWTRKRPAVCDRWPRKCSKEVHLHTKRWTSGGTIWILVGSTEKATLYQTTHRYCYIIYIQNNILVCIIYPILGLGPLLAIQYCSLNSVRT